MRRTRGVVRRSLICSLRPLEFLEDGTPLYPILGAQDDDGGAGDDSDEDDEEEDEEEDDSDDDKDDKSKPKPKPKQKPKETDDQFRRRLNREAKTLREAKEAAEAQLRAISDKDKSELELAVRDRDEYKSKLEKQAGTLSDLAFEVAFLRLDRDKYNWHDPEVVMDQLRKDKTLTVDEDGKVEGLADAVKAIAKSKPYLLKKAEDDGDEEEQDRRPVRGPSGKPVGSGRKVRTEKTTEAQRKAKIAEKYRLDQGAVVVQ